MKTLKIEKILKDVDKYYTNKILKYGRTPKGVNWKNEEVQIVRFKQLLKVVDIKNYYILNDLGCGYGSMYSYMNENNHKNFYYYGYDLSKEMVENARSLYGDFNNCEFFVINHFAEIKNSDYTVASGIFNVKMQYKEFEWLPYILETLDEMNKKSKKGFAFNILTKYSDKEYMRDDLYYADPSYFFDYCKRNFSRNISLLHDYELYEFTIIVRK